MKQEQLEYPALEKPVWLMKGNQVDEVEFCQEFLCTHSLIYHGGRFLTPEGTMTDEQGLYREIFDILSPWVSLGLSKKVEALVKCLRLMAYRAHYNFGKVRLNFRNGTLELKDGSFTGEKYLCRHRLNADYDPQQEYPTMWMCFLYELLEEEDIPTLQEYLGYCLLPINKAQKMLMLIGAGGEGKSVIGYVMKGIFGNNMVNNSIQKIETNRFARADLEGKLLMVDDDMDMSALPKTNYLKTLITAEEAVDVERKGVQSYQAQLYARFLCFGNGALTALHDRSNGFYRRQIILTTKPRRPDRKDDPFLKEALLTEKSAIVNWMIEGLNRLVSNDFHFTLSQKARENLKEQAAKTDSVTAFLSSQGYIAREPQGAASTRSLYAAYKNWCEDNAEIPLTLRSFCTQLSQKTQELGLKATTNITLPGQKRCRGYQGIQVIDPGVM